MKTIKIAIPCKKLDNIPLKTNKPLMKTNITGFKVQVRYSSGPVMLFLRCRITNTPITQKKNMRYSDKPVLCQTRP